VADAQALTLAAAEHAPKSPRPWMTLGRHLAAGGSFDAALAAYEHGAALSTPANWTPRLARPVLLGALGRPEAEAALAEAHTVSWNNDPWLALETAWRELPAPRTNQVQVGHDDYAAVRGFFYPRGGPPEIGARRLEWNRYERLGFVLPPPGTHRWSRHRAWLRLRPPIAAARYAVTLRMGYAFPAMIEHGRVAIRASDGSKRHFDVDRDLRDYRFDVAPADDGSILLRLDTPTWCRAGEPADQGVRVDRFSVEPTATP
jgi:hypothetical protein